MPREFAFAHSLVMTKFVVDSANLQNLPLFCHCEICGCKSWQSKKKQKRFFAHSRENDKLNKFLRFTQKRKISIRLASMRDFKA
ncbi:hypothetical protein [Helicobacter sp. 23-1045]